MHINDFLYDVIINENNELVLHFNIDGVEHTLGITKKDARRFHHLFEMQAMIAKEVEGD